MNDSIRVGFAEIANFSALLDSASTETPVSQLHLAEHLLKPRSCRRTTSGTRNLIWRWWPLSRLVRWAVIFLRPRSAREQGTAIIRRSTTVVGPSPECFGVSSRAHSASTRSRCIYCRCDQGRGMAEASPDKIVNRDPRPVDRHRDWRGDWMGCRVDYRALSDSR